MKYLAPLTLVILLTACASTPEDKEAAHQQQLEKEARENFYAMRAQLGTHPAPPPTPTPSPNRGLFAFAQPAPANPPLQTTTETDQPPPRPKRKPKPTPRNKNDTVYYWEVQPGQQQANAARYSKAELRYAHELAKRPEDLTADERLYAREHY